jgi:hypothetical protein
MLRLQHWLCLGLLALLGMNSWGMQRGSTVLRLSGSIDPQTGIERTVLLSPRARLFPPLTSALSDRQVATEILNLLNDGADPMAAYIEMPRVSSPRESPVTMPANPSRSAPEEASGKKENQMSKRIFGGLKKLKKRESITKFSDSPTASPTSPRAIEIVNPTFVKGSIALHAAVLRDAKYAVKALLSEKPEEQLLAENSDGITPVGLAVQENKFISLMAIIEGPLMLGEDVPRYRGTLAKVFLQFKNRAGIELKENLLHQLLQLDSQYDDKICDILAALSDKDINIRQETQEDSSRSPVALAIAAENIKSAMLLLLDGARMPQEQATSADEFAFRATASHLVRTVLQDKTNFRRWLLGGGKIDIHTLQMAKWDRSLWDGTFAAKLEMPIVLPALIAHKVEDGQPQLRFQDPDEPDDGTVVKKRKPTRSLPKPVVIHHAEDSDDEEEND